MSGSEIDNSVIARIEAKDGTNNNRFDGNLINGVQALGMQGGGFYLHAASNNTISHNLVENTGGVGIGLVNFDDTTINLGNTISFNTVLHTRQSTAYDSGSIYVLGCSQVDTGTSINNNYVDDTGPGNHMIAVYLDDFASGITVAVGGAIMDFICYLHAGWEPLIRPAEATRKWMDEMAEAFAYRCLSLDIANAHGWKVLAPCDVDAYWTGRPRVEDVVLRCGGDGAVSLFGHGVLTFHIQALFRTPPGWDLWISGSPNQFKSGIAPLTGVVEADWSPYTFTMNWKFTRRNHRVSFAKHEPICFLFPIQRGALERMTPKLVTLAADSDLVEAFYAWSRSRTAFQQEMADSRPRAPSEKWQKRYYRGVTMRSDDPVPGHQTKIRLKPPVSRLP